jgi:maltose 6'-phosphate phosphatase
VRYALYCRTNGQEHWENRNGANFSIQADAGLRLRDDLTVLAVDPAPLLQPEQKQLTVTVAVATHLDAQQVFVEWSGDGCKTVHRTPCFSARDHWEKDEQSNAGNPNQHGVQIWTARLRIRDAYRVVYAVGCTTPTGEIWDNNLGADYQARRADLKVLALNLHCYQEVDQDAKFSTIARAITELDVDLVCLQEVCENWNGGAGDWHSSAVRIIQERLGRTYYLHTDWAHRGFDRYREGVAILSKFPLLKQEARYLSRSQDSFNIHARKAVMVQVEVPNIGLVNLFSAHLSWWSDGFREQFDTLAPWANRRHTKTVCATLICGDFNAKAGAEGYSHVVSTSQYEDQFLRATNDESYQAIFQRHEANWQQRLRDDHRIDYIFLHRESRLKVTSARAIFTDNEYGRVSDHEGYFATFEPIEG